jgi:hypothetical protein
MTRELSPPLLAAAMSYYVIIGVIIKPMRLGSEISRHGDATKAIFRIRD